MSGNGVDLGAIYQAVLAISNSLSDFRTEITAEVRAQGARLDEQGRKLDDFAKEVRAYHGSVVGHGVLISELEERVGSLERRSPPEAA